MNASGQFIRSAARPRAAGGCAPKIFPARRKIIQRIARAGLSNWLKPMVPLRPMLTLNLTRHPPGPLPDPSA